MAIRGNFCDRNCLLINGVRGEEEVKDEEDIEDEETEAVGVCCGFDDFGDEGKI